MPRGIYERTQKHKDNISESRKGKPIHHPEGCQCPFCRSKRGEMSGGNHPGYGSKRTQETKDKMKENHKGMFGVKHKKETKEKIGIANSGERSHFWVDGRSAVTNSYPRKWTEILKDSIRCRDNYICQECGTHQDELTGRSKKLDVHHIDYDKENCDPDNLVSLCRKCHIITNFDREHWYNHFISKNYGK